MGHATKIQESDDQKFRATVIRKEGINPKINVGKLGESASFTITYHEARSLASSLSKSIDICYHMLCQERENRE